MPTTLQFTWDYTQGSTTATKFVILITVDGFISATTQDIGNTSFTTNVRSGAQVHMEVRAESANKAQSFGIVVDLMAE